MIYYIGNDLFSEYTVTTITECIKYCNSKKVIGLDIETTRKYNKNLYFEEVYLPGLDPYLSNIAMVQIGDLDNQFIIDARYINLSPLKEVLENKNVLKVGHNLKFEGKFFLMHDIKLINIWDTFLCEKVLYNGLKLGYSLESLMKRYLGIESVKDLDLFNSIEEIEEEEEYDEFDFFNDNITKPNKKVYIDKSTRLQFINIGDNPFTIKQIEYGVEDILSPLKIYEIQKKGRVIQDENGKDILYNPINGFYLQNKFSQVLASVEVEGIEFDPIKWIKVYENSKEKYAKRLTKLNEWVERNYKEKFCNAIDLFSSEQLCNIQWSSSKQVIKLFRYIGFCPKEMSKQTKKQEYTVGAKALFKLLPIEYRDKFSENIETEIVSQEDLILNYLLFKKSEQACTTFGKDFLKYVHPITGKIHSNYNQYMYTGRLSSTNPNLQNIPSGKEYRDCFCSKDFLWVNADYASQELKKKINHEY